MEVKTTTHLQANQRGIMCCVLNLFWMYSINEKGNYKRQGMSQEDHLKHEHTLYSPCKTLKPAVFVAQFTGAFRWV